MRLRNNEILSIRLLPARQVQASTFSHFFFLLLIFMAIFHGGQTTQIRGRTLPSTQRAAITITLSSLPSSSQSRSTCQAPPTSPRSNHCLRQVPKSSHYHQAPHASLCRWLNILHSLSLPYCSKPRLFSLQLSHQRLLQIRLLKRRHLLLPPDAPREYFAFELYFHVRDQSVCRSFCFQTG